MLSKLLLVSGVCCGVCFLTVGSLVGYSAWNDVAPTEAVHRLSHNFELCAKDCRKMAESAAAAVVHAGLVSQHEPDSEPSNANDDEFLTDRQKVIRYIADRVIEERRIPDISPEEIETATGVDLSTVPDLSRESIQMDVYQEMLGRGVDVEALFGSMMTCSRLSACSIHRNLMTATGEELARYEEEKALDGRTYENWMATDFSLPTTEGSSVSLSDYRGRPVMLTFMAGHCNHCLDSLALLSEIKNRHADLTLLPVYINSGSVEDVRSWTSEMDLGFPLVVAETADVAETYDSYLVPTTFLIDPNGRVVKRLVGFKDAEALNTEIASFLGQ